jgi:hypothetical protein
VGNSNGGAIEVGSSNATPANRLSLDAGNTFGYSRIISSNPSGFGNGNLILQVGNVGIGTNTPGAKLHVNGMIRTGSESGTSEPPNYPNSGLVIRRISATNIAAGTIVAVTSDLRLERDGSAQGWRINRIGGNANQVCNCTGVTSGGAVIAKTLNNLVTGITQLFPSADNVVMIHCMFGDPYNAGNMTEVNLTRFNTDYYWMGTLTSTFNQ